MKREFVYFRIFDKNWNDLELTDDDLAELENTLLINPQAGRLIKGTGGLRKLRVPLSNQGKSGGARVLYVDYISYEKTILMNVYSKSVQDTLTEKQKQEYKKLIEQLSKELKKNEKHSR